MNSSQNTPPNDWGLYPTLKSHFLNEVGAVLISIFLVCRACIMWGKWTDEKLCQAH